MKYYYLYRVFLEETRDKMSKKSRERREKHKAMRPDDYYTNGTIEMARFGKHTIIRNNRTEAEQADYLEYLASEYPAKYEAINEKIEALKKKICKCDPYDFYALRVTGALLFYPEGRTYSPPRRGGDIACGNRALCEADAAPAGALWTMPHHGGAAVIVHAVIASTPAFAFVSRGTICTPPCANCLRKSATGSFVAAMGIAPATPIFFLRKRNKNRYALLWGVPTKGR